MRATPHFDANLAALINPIHQHLDPVAPDELALPYRLLTPVDTVNLKDVLCQLDHNVDRLHDGLFLFKPVVWKRQFGNYGL